jgi:serine/threonine protein kinase
MPGIEQTPSFFEVGSVIADRYEVVRTLGTGGMGSVLEVVDRSLDNHTIALKLLYPHHVKDPIVFARFRNEVIVTRDLSHPNVVRLYDFGEAGKGYYYISMNTWAVEVSLSRSTNAENKRCLSIQLCASCIRFALEFLTLIKKV